MRCDNATWDNLLLWARLSHLDPTGSDKLVQLCCVWLVGRLGSMLDGGHTASSRRRSQRWHHDLVLRYINSILVADAAERLATATVVMETEV